ncbi:MAG: replicative DNA helicase, partial [Bacteroidetes bacterium]
MEEPIVRKRKKQPTYDEFPDFGKLPPQALEEEEAVLGALMIESNAFSQISEILRTPDYFYKVTHRKIFQAIRTLAAEGKPIDMLTVKDQLIKDKNLDDVGGMYAIAALTEKVATAAHIEEHAKIIAQKYLARRMILISNEIQTNAFDASKDVDELIQEAEGKIFDISQTNHKKDVVSIAEIIPAAIKRIEEASKNTGFTTGIESGFYKLDELTSGWQRSDLIIMAARPAMGKTAFVLTMAKNMA